MRWRGKRISRDNGVWALKDQIAQIVKSEPPEVQKYARVRWGTGNNYPVSTVDAANRMKLPLYQAVRYEERIRELLPAILPADLSVVDGNEEAAPDVTFDISPRILIATEAISSQMIRELRAAPDLLRGLHHRRFEEIIAYLFSAFGYDVELTKRTRDGGRDVIAVKEGEVNVRYLIECKHPYSGNPIGIGPVRELYAVKVDEQATKAILATTSYFSRDAQLFAERHKWELELRDYHAVAGWLNRVS